VRSGVPHTATHVRSRAENAAAGTYVAVAPARPVGSGRRKTMSIFCKYGAIAGDATHQDHKEWIAVGSLQWGVGRAISTPVGAAENREASEPSVSEVTMTKDMDCASIHLFKEACTGNKGVDCTIHLVQTGSPGRLVCEYKLTNSLVSGYSCSSGGDTPTESFSVNFTKVEFKYINYDPTGVGKPATAAYEMALTKAS